MYVHAVGLVCLFEQEQVTLRKCHHPIHCTQTHKIVDSGALKQKDSWDLYDRQISYFS